MSLAECVKNFMVAVEMADFERAASHITDNFTFSGWNLPQPIKAGPFLGMMSALKAAMPDWMYNLSAVEEHGGIVTATTTITATNTRDLQLPLILRDTIPATDLYVVLPQEKAEYSFEGEKISEMKVESLAGGGIKGLLQQVGGELASSGEETGL